MREESQPSQEEIRFPIMMKGQADEGESLFVYSKKSQLLAVPKMKKILFINVYLSAKGPLCSGHCSSTNDMLLIKNRHN